ncbi:MAG: 2,3,4,5-tetrahydropyridine-2,6-dicarboxylate N-succinyltransferase [Bdellovibrionales bacterium]|nr:2,3,4,5-tetrahydropyridine-2,6-dicarboxylate N-succinyltransferase [Bdellovibrionales bacterium]
MIAGSQPPETLRLQVEAAWEKSTQNPAAPLSSEAILAVEETVGLIDRGRARVCSPGKNGWETHAWLKQAILLYFRSHYVQQMDCDPFQWTDKIPVKKWSVDMGVRVVPPAVVRFGAFVAKGAVLMPSYVNVGAFVDEGTMVDTWATVGSCAQIGKNVHLSGGVGIGGVLEPPQASPVIIEDNCFVGSRCVVVEGVHVKRGAVLGAGLVLTKSTAIIDVRGSEAKTFKGEIPENAVVIPGSRSKKFPAGDFDVPCALIIGTRSESTDEKTSLNQVLREFEIPV